MQRYDSYKDSGVKWLGEIPSHWELCKIKNHYKMMTGFTPSTGKDEFYSDDKRFAWVNISDMKTKYVDDTKSHLSELYVKTFKPQIIPEGSLLYSFKLSVGNVAFARKQLYTNEAIASFVNSTNVCLNFLYYSAPYFIIKNANTNIYGAFILNQDLINNAFVVFPPLKEQEAIANYLDAVTSKIDDAIAQQQKMIDLLNERKQIIINDAVTKGLNPDAPMKDSGVDWIGEIPSHWELKPYRYLFYNLDYLRMPITADQRSRNNPQYDYYGASGIIDKIDYYNVEDKVLLIGEDGANLLLRNLPLIYKANGRFWVNNHAHILKPIRDNYDYMAYVMEAADYTLYVTGSAQPKLSQSNLNSVKLPIPPFNEQEQIVKYLSLIADKIDRAIKESEKMISLLQERKQIIINEVVTGKVKVV